jgi:hypothetical protein
MKPMFPGDFRIVAEGAGIPYYLSLREARRRSNLALGRGDCRIAALSEMTLPRSAI